MERKAEIARLATSGVPFDGSLRLWEGRMRVRRLIARLFDARAKGEQLFLSQRHRRAQTMSGQHLLLGVEVPMWILPSPLISYPYELIASSSAHH